MKTIKPYGLKSGDVIGIFTPSWPAHCIFRDKFEFGLSQIEKLGFKVKLGSLTKLYSHEGYRTANAKLRAREFMELIEDESVNALMSTIGGSVTNGMLPYLDYQKIRQSRKPVIGYSDVTSLLLAINAKSNLVVFYGPAVVPSFGEYPVPLDLTISSFIEATGNCNLIAKELKAPDRWSNQLRSAFTEEWKTGERQFQKNSGWEIINKGEAEGESLVANLNTLSACLGTPYVPSFKGKILFLEQMLMDMEREERQLTQLLSANVFDEISGLVVSKPENYDQSNSQFDGKALYKEILADKKYPIIWNFDCGHTHPSITLPIGCKVFISAGEQVKVILRESAVEAL